MNHAPKTTNRRTGRCVISSRHPFGGFDSEASWLANLVTRKERLAATKRLKLAQKRGRTDGTKMERLKGPCFWHVTPSVNRASILANGLLPEFSENHAVWLVTTARVRWAQIHTRRRHATNDVWLIRVGKPRGLRVTRRWRGVYFTKQAIRV